MYMPRRGFTIVELTITIVVMAIILSLVIINLTNSQVSARDTSRKGNAETIVRSLERYYDTGVTSPNGVYPSTALIGSESTYLPDLDTNALNDPADSNPNSDLVAATNATQTTSGVAPVLSSSNIKYIYQPIASDNTLCTNSATQICIKFNLYYYLESSNTIVKIESAHR